MHVSQDRDKAALQAQDHYPAMHDGFRWHVPAAYNIAQVCCRRWTDAADAAQETLRRIASIDHSTLRSCTFYTYF